MTNMSIQPLWLTHFIEVLLVLEFQLTKFIVGTFSYKSHFRPQISCNENLQGCFTFYRASNLDTFTKQRSLSFKLFTEFFFFLSTLLFSIYLSVYSSCAYILRVQIYNLLLYIENFQRLTLKTVITIYLETWLQQFNSTGLYTRDATDRN